MLRPVVLCVVLCCFSLVLVSALNNGLARTPQMGWNSWNHFHCTINETLIRATAKAMVTTGLKAAGYNYVNMDDCWALSRTANGTIVADPRAFPSGIKALADYVHSLGLKFGLYSDAGLETCAGRPGSLGYETSDANTYAIWGVDYLKYDNCNDNNIPPEIRYPVMRDALNKTGRHILYSMCEWGVDNPATWAPTVGNSWRTTGDISDNWASMLNNLDINNMVSAFAGPGGWNDPDMLEVGNGGMTTTEYIAHFSLWAVVKAPLLIGTDVTNMSPDTLSILTAPEVIAVNQDPMGIQGRRVQRRNATQTEVWAGPLSDHSVAAVLLNRSPMAASITVNWARIGLNLNTICTVRDLWARQTITSSVSGSWTAAVPSHGAVFVRIIPNKKHSS